MNSNISIEIYNSAHVSIIFDVIFFNNNNNEEKEMFDQVEKLTFILTSVFSKTPDNLNNYDDSFWK